jgi:CRP-like cAMP-binding protein
MNKQEVLGTCLAGIGRFSATEIALIIEHGSFKNIKKNEFLLAKGDVCSSIYFLLKGACYQYHIPDVDEQIIELYTETDCVLNQSSFVFQQPSTEAIKAFIDCEVFILNVFDLHALIGKSPVFFQLGTLLQASSFRLSFFDKAMTPQEKYTYLLENKPQLLRVFPLKYIASYLKIAPETLSRVRAL